MTDLSVTEEFDSQALFSSSLNVDLPTSSSLSPLASPLVETNGNEHNHSFNESIGKQDSGSPTSASPSHEASNETSYAEVLKQVNTDDFHHEFSPRNDQNRDDSENNAVDPSETFDNNDGEGEAETNTFNVEDPSDTFLDQDDAKLLLIDEDSTNSRANFDLERNSHEKPDELK